MKIKKMILTLIGEFLIKIKRRIKREPSYTTSANYWEHRYFTGGNSGAGSYNNLAEFKTEIINSFLSENKILSVIEFGCGDGNQLQYFNFKKYIGYDVSPTIISHCQELYRNDTSKQFKLLNNYSSEIADLTLSLDVIYHLVEDETFMDHMNKLFYSSDKFVIIYSSNFDEADKNSQTDFKHVKHRKFTDWIENHVPNFRLIKHIPNKYTIDGNISKSSLADFYIYQKIE